jgi:hypothetical protein
MNLDEQIFKLIERHYPDEFDEAGPSKVKNISKSVADQVDMSIESSERGMSFDLLETLKLVLVVAQLAKVTIDIVKSTKKGADETKPEAKAIYEQAKSKLPPGTAEKLEEQQSLNLVRDVIDESYSKAVAGDAPSKS